MSLALWADNGVSFPNYNIATAAGSSWVGDGHSATSAILIQAEGVCLDSKGDVYIADSSDNRVREVTPDGVIHTVAGTGTRGSSGDGGPAEAALLNSPYGLACDSQGDLYIADLGNARVRKLSQGIITTIAGGGGALGSLSAPRDLALDGVGNLYISDFTGQRIYELPVSGTLTRIAGTGAAGAAGDGGLALDAELNYPAGLAFDQGALYIADSGNHLVRAIRQGIIGSVAQAVTPTGVAFDAQESLYIADPTAGQVLKIPPGGKPEALLAAAAQDLSFGPDGSLYVSQPSTIIRLAPAGSGSTFAGGGDSAHGDTGSAIGARLNRPSGVAVDAAGDVYIADRNNNRIRRVTPNGVITSAISDGLSRPSSVSVDAAGNLYIADTGHQSVQIAAPDGTLSVLVNKNLLAPVYAIPDGAGNVYIADADAGRIVKSDANGLLSVVLSGLNAPRGLALDATGNLYFTETGAARVSRLAPGGTLAQLAAGTWKLPEGLAVDGSGNVFVADAGLQQVVAIDSSGRAAAIAGTGSSGYSGDGEAALDATLAMPFDVALLPGGSMVVADLDNNRVRLLVPVASAPAPPPASVLLPSVVNAASLVPGPVAPAMLLLLQNTGLAPADIVNTQILFGSAAARILSADSNGVLVVAPPDIAGMASVTIDIVLSGTSLASIPVAVSDSAVALFTGAPGQAAVNNQDGSINGADNPAPRGSIISLYGTGLGLSGAMASVSIGGFPAQVLYSGPVAQYPGLFQVNATIPAGYFPPGDVSVIVTEGSSSSQTGISIWVD